LRDAYKNVYRIDGGSFFSELNNIVYPKSIAPAVVVKGVKDDKAISKNEIEWLMNTYNTSYQEFDGGHTANLPEETFKELLT
jgi:surfactin synthase thioesterase subunit